MNIGDLILFGRENGEKTRGRIVGRQAEADRILVPLVTLAFVALTFALGQVAGCSGSRPYGTPGVQLYAYLAQE